MVCTLNSLAHSLGIAYYAWHLKFLEQINLPVNLIYYEMLWETETSVITKQSKQLHVFVVM